MSEEFKKMIKAAMDTRPDHLELLSRGRSLDWYNIVKFSNVYTIETLYDGNVHEFFSTLCIMTSFSKLLENGFKKRDILDNPEMSAAIGDIDEIITWGNHNKQTRREIFSTYYVAPKKQNVVPTIQNMEKYVADGRVLKWTDPVGIIDKRTKIFTLPEPELIRIFESADEHDKILRASPVLFTKRQRRLIHKFWPEAELTIVPEDII
jgi:hypothetical protein